MKNFLSDLLLQRKTSPLTLSLLCIALVSGCSQKESHDPKAARAKIIRIDGSSTVYPITEAVSEEFQIATPNRVTVGISGTGGGFKKFCRGEVDIAEASRPIQQKEIEACAKAGITFVELPIAYDAITIAVSKQNTFLNSISLDELKKMWSPSAQDTINTWQQVNPSWPDVPLHLFGAGSDSGTFDYFTEAVVGKAKSSRGDYTASEDDNVLVQGVASDVHALGFFGFAYFETNQDKLRAVPVTAKSGAPAVMPSHSSVIDGSYKPLSRPMFIYVKASSAQQRPEVKAFVDFYIQQASILVKEVGYIPLSNAEYKAVEQHWQAMITGSSFHGKMEIGLSVQDLLQTVKSL